MFIYSGTEMTRSISTRKHLALLTATITPPRSARNLARMDPVARMHDYLTALSHYLDLLTDGTLDGLVFAENSASPLTPLEELVNRRGLGNKVEFLSHNGLNYPPSYGRGYGEFKLLDHAMQGSRLVAELSDKDLIWKITGRYRLDNLPELVAGISPDVELTCQCRNYPIRWMDLFVLAWTQHGHEQHVKSVYKQLREDEGLHSAEVTYRQIVDQAVARGAAIQRRFCSPPELTGVRGSDNQQYQEMALKKAIRSAANRYTPWLWI